jgi:hypothetical protein
MFKNVQEHEAPMPGDGPRKSPSTATQEVITKVALSTGETATIPGHRKLLIRVLVRPMFSSVSTSYIYVSTK